MKLIVFLFPMELFNRLIWSVGCGLKSNSLYFFNELIVLKRDKIKFDESLIPKGNTTKILKILLNDFSLF